jgi:hypothetical protein
LGELVEIFERNKCTLFENWSIMARGKKVLKEIEIDSGSDVSDVEQPVAPPPKKPKLPSSKDVSKDVSKVITKKQPVEEEEDDDSVAERPVVSKKPLSDKKLEALRIANEARLRRKIEREILEQQEAEKEKERRLEEKILSLIGKHVPRPSRKKQKAVPVQASEGESDESEEDLPPPKQYRRPRPTRANSPVEMEQEEQVQQPQQVNYDPAYTLFSQIFK